MQQVIEQLQAERQDLINQNKQLAAEKESVRTASEEERKRHHEELSRMEHQINEQKAKAARYYQVIVKQGRQEEGLDDQQLAKEFRELRYKADNLVRNFYQAKKLVPHNPIDPEWHKEWLAPWNKTGSEMRNYLAMAGIFETLYNEMFTRLHFGVEPTLNEGLACFESHAGKSEGGKRTARSPSVCSSIVPSVSGRSSGVAKDHGGYCFGSPVARSAGDRGEVQVME